MKKFFVKLFFGFVLLFCAGFSISSVFGEKLKPVVFLLPHQDDELFMAGAIHRAVNTGRPVYTVMVTNGGASVARYIINGVDDRGRAAYSPWHKKVHKPAKEGYKPLSKLEFVQERNREYYVSMLRLGVRPENILFANPGGRYSTTSPTYLDGKLTPELAREVIQKYFDQIGDGTYVTVAAKIKMEKNKHPDHFEMRQALLSFPGISEKLLYSEKKGFGSKVMLAPEEFLAKRKALEEYTTWDPQNGKYAVGKHSVSPLFDIWWNTKEEYVTKLAPAL